MRPDLDSWRALVEGGSGRDRAFVDGMIRMAWMRTTDARERDALSALHGAVREAGLRSHASLRAEIVAQTLRGAALRRRLDEVPRFERDHFVEEVLGIAYPPLDEPDLPPELIAYAPSGYDELVHVFDATGLDAGDRFVDIGSGLGKGVMLAALLTGAGSAGVERDSTLHGVAEGARQALGPGLDAVRFQHGDARDAALEDADVVFMYLPFIGRTLASVLDRLTGQARRAAPRARGRFLCAATLDLDRYPELVAVGPPQSWLQIYAWR